MSMQSVIIRYDSLLFLYKYFLLHITLNRLKPNYVKVIHLACLQHFG